MWSISYVRCDNVNIFMIIMLPKSCSGFTAQTEESVVFVRLLVQILAYSPASRPTLKILAPVVRKMNNAI